MTNHVENEKLIRRYYDAMNARDFDTLWQCFADDVVYTDAAMGESFTSLEDFKSFYLETMLPLDVSLTLEQIITTDTGYAVTNRFHGKHVADFPGLPKTGKSFSVPSASFGTIENGRIKSNTDYWNLHDLLIQLGFVDAPA
jgi:steroid delta-isomerase-like uncharacterized protein